MQPKEPHAGHRVELVSGIDALPGGLWRGLAPADDPLWSRPVFSAMERGAIGPDGYAYLVVRRGARVVAVLPLCLFGGLRLDRVVGPGERRLLAPVAARAPRLLRLPTLFCGHLLGQGHVLGPGRDDPAVARLLVGAVLEFARARRLRTVILKDFAADELAPLRGALRQHGFTVVPSLPDTELRLPHRSFDAHIAALPAKPRRNARSNIRKFAAHPGLRMEVLDSFAHLLPQILGLYRQVMDRADQTLDELDAAFLAALRPGDGLRPRLVACFAGDRLVAFLLCLFSGAGATGARIGLDYALAHEARLYHNVHYAAIRLAIAAGCRHIRFAQTAYTPKVEFGCDLVAQHHAITHLRPFRRALLRRVLPPALARARADALGRHARDEPRPPDPESRRAPCPE
ncbi:GNAT family N-acetyltransferase [Streptomyces marincola]|uniref:GNAT family N-acetyltransferase n=1 Tax=Streptomyces marincola TaxID=2878388 RepID=A0A1W7CVT6_9ACTN|nr:GNAT family N-acetyltransferase [Streptomyces marincola]ARQ68816.1 GNAT family N-acetyltransferase [Streptomyces marincola]